jgi:hypothetical protein
MNYRVILVGLALKACIAVILVLPLLQPAAGHATYFSGTDIPLIDGARIVKEKQFQGSGRFEFEVDLPPSEAVEFYHQAMQARGWPAGRVMSNGKACVLMLMRQGGMMTVQAGDKEGRTLVTIVLVETPQTEGGEKACGTQPIQGPQALKGSVGNGSPAKFIQDQSIRLPIQTPVADHRLTMFLAAVSKDSSLELDKPLVIHFSGPVEPAFFDFKITPDMGKWAARWSKDFSHVTLVPDFPLKPDQNLHLKATVLGGPEIDRTLQIRRLSPARQLAHDLKTGRIDINQAARYRLYSLFKPSQVPEPYRRKHRMPSGTPVLKKIIGSLDDLDASTRQEIVPYLLSPFNPRSIWHEQLQASYSASSQGWLFALVSPAFAGDVHQAKYTTADGFKLIVYGWGKVGAEQVVKARNIIRDETIYEEFKKLLGRDVPARSKLLPIYIVDSLPDAKGLFDPGEQASEGNFKIFISNQDCMAENELGGTLAHEIFHAFQMAFYQDFSSKAQNQGSAEWLEESTAVWAEDFINKEWNVEQDFADDAFEEEAGRTWPLGTDDEDGVYGLYLFPYYLTKVNPHTDSVIRLIWENRADGDSEIESIENAVADLDDVWKAFSLATLDVEPEDGKMPDTVGDKYGGFDPLFLLTDHGFQKLTLDKKGIATGLVDLDGYQSAYFEIVNSLQGADAPAVSFDLTPFQKHADKVSVQAVIHYRDGRKAYEDWTGRDERLFCLNREDQNFSWLFVVVGCSDDDLEVIEPLAISPEPTSRCRSGVVTLTRRFEEREQLDSTTRITMDATETQSRRASGNRSVTLRLDLDLSEKILPEQRDALDQMEVRVENAKADQVKQVRKMMENMIKTPQARLDKETGLMKVRYRIKNCRIDTGGGAYRSRSQGVRTDASGISTQWETNFTRNWSATGITTDTRKRIERGHIRAEVFYEPKTGKIQWVRVPQLDIDMHVTENSSGYYSRRSQDGYLTTPKSGSDSKDETFNMTYSSGGKARKGLPMDPVWRARQSAALSASGHARIEKPINHEYSEVNKKGFRKGMLTESFEWSLHLRDEPTDL